VPYIVDLTVGVCGSCISGLAMSIVRSFVDGGYLISCFYGCSTSMFSCYFLNVILILKFDLFYISPQLYLS
jgi:hypothetical protein